MGACTFGVNYSYERCYSTITPSFVYRNNKFTNIYNASCVHTNPDPYRVQNITNCSAIGAFDTEAYHGYDVVFESAIYIVVAGIIVRAPTGIHAIQGNDYFYISQVQL